MTIAYFCVLIAIILPVVWSGYSKRPFFKQGNYDNNAPRPLMQTLEGQYLRADWAQQNAFEALPGFAAAVIIAHLGAASQVVIDTLAVVFIIARIGHGICYIKDLATLRSLCYGVGMLSVIGLFIAAF